MNELTAVLIDDEPLAIDTLRWQLEQFCPFVSVAASFNNPCLAMEYLKNHQVDLCFLDIDMPEMSGFEFLQQWNNVPPFAVIFATAYSEFAVKAFRVSAFDYLLKPVDEEELVKTLNTFNRQINQQRIAERLSLLESQIVKPAAYPGRIALSTQEGIHLVDTSSIVRLEAASNYTTVFLADGATLLLSKNLRQIEDLLNPAIFLRVHQSHTVSLDQIKLYQRGRGGSVILHDGTLIPVSKQRKDKLMQRLGM
ncbi:DNA-binding response regulator [Lewinellaceae bacterium SD302]|nr:DNA-binding response regulator [Lewinellaceae bacterium SD302]